MAVDYQADEGGDACMDGSVARLSHAVVGHRIVSAQNETTTIERWGNSYKNEHFVITLDDGTKVALVDDGDCCAYTTLRAFLLNVEKIDHVITAVKTTNDYTRWHILADMEAVLELTVDWSEGSGYYSYGFNVVVKAVDS